MSNVLENLLSEMYLEDALVSKFCNIALRLSLSASSTTEQSLTTLCFIHLVSNMDMTFNNSNNIDSFV